MGILDKLKNALFEEEYVEVEEKPKAKKESVQKEKIKSKGVSKKDEPIAKKIVLSEKNDDYDKPSIGIEEDNTALNEKVVDDEFVSDRNESSNFKVMDENDFKVDKDDFEINKDDFVANKPEILRVIDNEEDTFTTKPVVEARTEKLYQGNSQSSKVSRPYGIDETPQISVHEYGGYEKKEERTYFKPSPIISPIYGILDKNYKKDDIVTRKEVRLSSSFSRDKLNVDDVRKKAFGDLSDEIESATKDISKGDKPAFDLEEESLLVDLSLEEAKPEVKEVTVGDALEYFQDLGLEYNVDYVDATKSVGRRSDKDISLEKEVTVDMVDTKLVEEESKIKSVADLDDDSTDDNLFDLIDSMYKDED